MRTLCLTSAALLLAALAGWVVAADGDAAPAAAEMAPAAPKPPCPAGDVYDMPSLAQVDWIGPALDLDSLYGQTVMLVFVESWCPKCNQWADERADEVQAAMVDHPVTLVYLGVRMSKREMQSYAETMRLKGHSMGVVSEAFAAQCGMEDTLWDVLVLDPHGRRVDSGTWGRYVASMETGKGKSVYAAKMGDYCRESPPIVDSADTPELRNADLAVRLGMYGKAAQFLERAGDAGKEALERLTARGKAMVDAAKAYEADAPYLAWRLAAVAGREFRKADFAAEARELAARLAKDKAVRKERTADGALVKIAASGKGKQKTQRMMLSQLALKFPETRGGRIAQRMLKVKTDVEE